MLDGALVGNGEVGLITNAQWKGYREVRTGPAISLPVPALPGAFSATRAGTRGTGRITPNGR